MKQNLRMAKTIKPIAMTLLVSVATLLMIPGSYADELMKWERIPLQIPLKVGQERVIFADKNVRVGFPVALNGKLRVQSSGGVVYLKAESAFPQTRLQLQDVESGEIILLDITAGEKGSAEPVRLVYSGELTTLASAKSTMPDKGNGDDADVSSAAGSKSARVTAPVPVVLTRYAAQSLYAPLRTIEAAPGIRAVSSYLPAKITTLYPSESVTVSPLAAWSLGTHYIVALKLRNRASHKVILDPRALQGRFVTATFQHRYLGALGTPEDTTTLYLVTELRPDKAFIREPAAARKKVKP